MNTATSGPRFGMVLAAGLFHAFSLGCAATDPPPTPGVATAIERSRRDGDTAGGAQAAAPSTPARASDRGDESPAIAVINGQELPRSTLVDPLLRQYGADLLEHHVVLIAARQRARSLGIVVTGADVRAEYRRALDSLADPLASQTPGDADRDDAEALLDEVLARRHISREMFMMGMERNAYLRNIIEAEIEVSDEALRAEYDRRHGPRVRVRHVQLGSLRDAERVIEQAERGEDFAELARRYSVNTASRDDGGLLAPFTRDDDEVPAPLRAAAFRLGVGETSDAVRVGAWYHVIRVDERIAAADPGFDDERESLRPVVIDRLVATRMQAVYESLLREADVHVNDPVLREVYEASRERGGSRSK